MMEIETTSPKVFVIREGGDLYRHKLHINNQRTCQCGPTHINCMTAKEWIRCQLGVWQFSYEARDIRDKNVHPATFPISLTKRVIELFTHEGELILDPFVGSGTSLVAASDTGRNAVGFDLHPNYVDLCYQGLIQGSLLSDSKQLPVQDDARCIAQYFDPETVSLIWTSPPYANLLNRERKNKSRRFRKTEQLGKVEQYSQDIRDLAARPRNTVGECLGV